MRASILNAEIRGVEAKTNAKGGRYLVVRYEEDRTGKPMTIIDKDMEREQFYKRGVVMNLEIEIDQGRQFTTIRVIDAKQI